MHSITTPIQFSKSTAPAHQPAPAPRAIHESFSWLVPHPERDPGADLIALALDVSLGIQTCLELVHSNSTKRSLNALTGPGDQACPLLKSCESDRLLRLAMVSASLLSNAAENHIEWLNAKRTKVPE